MDNQQNSNFISKYFQFSKFKTNTKTEIIAGITTFLTCVYIAAVNPSILSAAGMDTKSVFYATVIAAGISCLVIGIWANLPFALAPAMGLNAYFAFTVVDQLGLSWQNALGCVFISGVIFTLLGLFGFQQKIVDAMPDCIKKSVGVGIGLFIAFTGMFQSGMVSSSPDTLIQLGDFSNPGALLALLGLILIVVLHIKNVKGGILIGILAVTIAGFFFTNPATGETFTQLPKAWFSFENPISALKPTLFQLSFKEMFTGSGQMLLGSIFAIISFLFVDLFDSIGVLLGVSVKAGMVDKDGNVPHAGRALFVSSIGAAIGALLGTSTVTIYGAESTSGIAEGGRTGFTSVVVGILFFLTMFLSPIFLIIPSIATAPALIMVGIFMIEPITSLDLGDISIALPVFLTITIMPFGYNIAYGILFGIIGYTIGQVTKNGWKSVNGVIKILTVLFLAYFVLDILI